VSIRPNYNIDLAALRSAIAAAAPEIAQAYLGQPNSALSTKRELRFGRQGSLAVVIAGPKSGLWHDHSDDSGGDMIALIQFQKNCSFQEALQEVTAFIGSAAPQGRPVGAFAYQDDVGSAEKKKAIAGQIWAGTKPLIGSPSEAYLRKRLGLFGANIPPRLDEAIRFHPGVRFGEEVHPAMVAAITNIHSDELQGVHLTAIDTSGSPIKLEGKTKRRIRGIKKGGAIKLTPDDEVCRSILIGEGIETTLSAMGMTDFHGWALIDAGMLKAFPVLSGIETLVIAVDADPAGIAAASAAKARWSDAGREVFEMKPSEAGTDFNDIVRSAANDQ
jgi:hypothetical protein